MLDEALFFPPLINKILKHHLSGLQNLNFRGNPRKASTFCILLVENLPANLRNVFDVKVIRKSDEPVTYTNILKKEKNVFKECTF